MIYHRRNTPNPASGHASNSNIRPYLWNTPNIEYAKAFWAAVTMWTAGGHDAMESKGAISDHMVMPVCLETCGDHAQSQDPHIALHSNAIVMIGLRSLEGGQV